MAKSAAQTTEKQTVREVPVGPLKSVTKGSFTVMSIDSAAYQKESAARKNRNREAELKILDAETRATIEAANAQGKGVMWKKPDGSSYLFTGKKPNEQATDKDKKKKEEKDGFLGWCKRNWGWLLGGAIAIATAAYFLIRNKKKKQDKKKNKSLNNVKKGTNTQPGGGNSSNDNNNTPGGGNSSNNNNNTPGGGNSSNDNNNTPSGGNSSNDNNNTPGGGNSSTKNDNSSDGNLSVSDTSHSSGNDANTQSSGSSLKDIIHANSGGFVQDDNCGVYDNGLGGGRFR